MRLEPKPDDLCGNCGHVLEAHQGNYGSCIAVVNGDTAEECCCGPFVPPIVARLVEALDSITPLRASAKGKRR